MNPLLTTRERLEMIRQDCKDDAARYDGLPFTGRTMAPILGEHLAMIDALAASMLELEDRIASLEVTLDRAEAAAIRRARD